MINPNTGERELAYLVQVDSIEPIVGSDNCEAAIIGGWSVLVRKNIFQPNDLAIYFEIDSQVDLSKPEFAFMEKYKGRVKTQRYTFGGKNPGFYSQGLLMAPADFGWEETTTGQFAGDEPIVKKPDGKCFMVGDFLTKELNVTYYVAEDNKRKANINPDAKINAALARHPKIAKRWGKVIKKNKVLRWLFLLVFGRGVSKKIAWPSGVPKSDEERVQNMIWILENKEPLIATEKIDGSSSTFYLTRPKGLKKAEYKVCSRNVVFDTPDKPCYYDTMEGGPGNIYLEMDQKYGMRECLEKILEMFPEADWVGLQAEIFGAKVQKRDYGRTDRDLRAFSLYLSNKGRVGTVEMKEILDKVGVPSVPILNTAYVLPDTIEELMAYVQSEKSREDGGLREGIVFRAQDGGLSFKCVDPEFLLKYHG